VLPQVRQVEPLLPGEGEVIYGQDDLLGVAAAVREVLALEGEAFVRNPTAYKARSVIEAIRAIPTAELLKRAEALARSKR
jgi:hypothetical protein